MRIGITAGDPAGIGLEIVLRSLPSVLPRADWILFAESGDFEASHRRFASQLAWSPFSESASIEPGRFWFCPTGTGDPAEWGLPSEETGRRALAALEEASRRAGAGALAAIVTAPLSKQFVGKGFSGQTEFLQERSEASRAAMAFFTESFKVVLATTHLAISEVVSSLSVASYREIICLIDAEFRGYGYPPPRIAVAALNPHAGEGGMFGTEEASIIEPAVVECARSGIQVSGPFPADSLYSRAYSGEFDVVLAPYHDQGLIPVKLVAPHAAANVTLGLPYVRTSPDHGTAFGIAGRGEANIGGIQTALEWAIELAARRQRMKDGGQGDG